MSDQHHPLRQYCERLAASPWTGVSSFWAAKNILDLISQVEALTAERDRFAVHLARIVSAP